MKTTKRILSMLLCMALVLGMIPVFASAAEVTTATLSFASTDNRLSQDTSQQVWSQNGITFTNNKASSSTNVANYSNPVRLYASSEIIVEAPGNITKIEFTCNAAKYATALNESITGSSISGSVVTVTLDGTTTSFTATLTAQVRLNSLTVYYTVAGGEGGDTTCTEHTFNPATCTAPKICSVCGATEGEALGHTFSAATCTAPKICSVCSVTEGPALGHTDADANRICDVCEAEIPNFATITFDDINNRTVGTTEQQVWVQNSITVTNDKGSSTSNVNTSYYAPVRFYKSSDVTISLPAGYLITKIIFDCASGYADIPGGTTIELSTPANSHTITMSNAQVRVNSITVYYNTTSNDTTLCDHEIAYTATGETAAIKHIGACSKCEEPMAEAAFHDVLGENDTCSVCGYAVDTTVLFSAILTEAYALESGATISGSVTLIVKVNSHTYNETYNYYTTDIVVGDDTARPIQCYKLAGDGVATLTKGDTITVTGTIKNYNGTIEFDSGCQLVAVEKHTCEYTYVANGTLGHYQQCSI